MAGRDPGNPTDSGDETDSPYGSENEFSDEEDDSGPEIYVPVVDLTSSTDEEVTDEEVNDEEDGGDVPTPQPSWANRVYNRIFGNDGGDGGD